MLSQSDEYVKSLKVKLMTVLHPSYRPKDGFLGFGNAHSGQSFFEFEIKADTEIPTLSAKLNKRCDGTQK